MSARRIRPSLCCTSGWRTSTIFMQDPGCACCREVCIKPRLAYKTPGMEKESRLAPAPRYLMHRAAPRSERPAHHQLVARSEEHTSELQSLMRISYAVSCL